MASGSNLNQEIKRQNTTQYKAYDEHRRAREHTWAFLPAGLFAISGPCPVNSLYRNLLLMPLSEVKI